MLAVVQFWAVATGTAVVLVIVVTLAIIVISSNKRDLAMRCRLEKQDEIIRHTQKMEAIGLLAGGVAHDFNNFMAIIKLNCSLIRHKLDPSNPMNEYLDEIELTSQRAVDLTRQLLAFGSKQKLSPRVLNLHDIFLKMNKMLHQLIGEHIEVITRFDRDIGLVNVDPGQIEQVIMNLAINARDAMPLGGVLTIEVGNAVLDEHLTRKNTERDQGPYVRIRIKDSGKGMEPDVLKHIFEPFYTTKAVDKGTGLGLSTVYGIIQQSGGEIRVESTVGVGTTFDIYIPVVEGGIITPRSPVSSQSKFMGEETILLVEDEPSLLTATRDILEIYGYHVLEANGGSSAIDLCENYGGPIHLMVTDVVMPRMSGPDLALKVHPMRPDMRMLFVSGFAEEFVHKKTPLLDSHPFLQKPYGPDVLVEKVREVLKA